MNATGPNGEKLENLLFSENVVIGQFISHSKVVYPAKVAAGDVSPTLDFINSIKEEKKLSA